MPKRKTNNKMGSTRPSKKMRMNSSTDSSFSEEEEFLCPCCVHEEEQQSLARTARSRQRKTRYNRQVLRNRSVSATSRRGRTRGRERRNALNQRNRPRCTPRRRNQESANNRRLRRGTKSNGQASRKRRAPATPRRGGNRGRERRNTMPYNRARPRCTPRQEINESRQSSPLLATSNVRKRKKSKRQALIQRSASTNARRSGIRRRKRRNMVKYNQSSTHSIGEKRARGKIPRRKPIRNSSSSVLLPSLEGVTPGQFLIIFSEPESDPSQPIIPIMGENFTNPDSLNSKTNMNDSREVQVFLPEAPTEHPANSAQVTQNKAICEDEQEAVNVSEFEEPLATETDGEAQVSSESAIELQVVSEEAVYRVFLVQNQLEEIVDAEGVDMLAGGDGPHVIDQRAVDFVLQDGDIIIALEISSDEFESPGSSNIEILNSHSSSGEEHQQNEEDVGADYVQRPLDEDSEQTDSI